VCRCAIVPGGQRNVPLGIPQSTPPQPRMSNLPRGEKYPIGNTPKPLWLKGLVAPHRYRQPLPNHATSVQLPQREPQEPPELPQHPLPVGPPWGICNKHQIKCVHWGHHFRAKVPRVGAVTLGIHHAKYPKRIWGLGYFVPKYPQKGQKYGKSGNTSRGIHTPKNTPGIPNGVFNPGYFLSFSRSVAGTRRRSQ
jgi:hypothetical protein